MKVSKVYLHNFRCFEDSEIALDPRMTVITGEKASEKSCTLAALTLGMSAYLSGVSAEGVRTPAIARSDIRYKTNTVGDMTLQEEQLPVIIGITASFDQDEEICWRRVKKTLTGRTSRVESRPARQISSGFQDRLRKGDDSLILPVLRYFGTENSELPKVSERNLPAFERLSGYIDCLDSKSDHKLLMKWILKRSWAEFQKKTPDPQLKAIYSVPTEVFEAFSGMSNAEFSFDPIERDLALHYDNPDDTSISVLFSKLPVGYRNLLVILTDLAWRMTLLNPQLKDPSKEVPGIVMIDDIERHLPTEWHGRILPVLQSTFPKIQFVVTTSSPAVIHSVPACQIRVIEDGRLIE